MLLQDLASRSACERPDARAVTMSGESLTYGELEAASNRLARLLRESGAGQHDRVCLFLPKAPMTVAAMLGALKADCVYVPIDLASPPARVGKIVAAADPAAVFVSGKIAGELIETLRVDGLLRGVSIVSLENVDFLDGDSTPLNYRSSPDDPAHILFTSGSTGEPKGVVVTHRNVASFVEWATSYFGMRAADRISGHPPFHFDLSTFDIYGSIAVGAELHLVPPEANLLPQNLADFIRSSELTQWFSVPSTMTYMAKFGAVPEAGFPTLERVIWCGEVLPTPVLVHWMHRVRSARFTNLYGPTETTIASSHHTVPACPADETASIPIGTACAGEELLILDDELAPMPAGTVGELYIGGVGVTCGYWRDEHRTAAAFVPDPRSPDSERRLYKTGDLCQLGDDGLVYFLGRNDSQIKSRGYRIELGEIEAALATIDGLRESAVVAVESDGFEGVAICCAFVPTATNGDRSLYIRRRLRRLVPAYMLPSRWHTMTSLPKNANGKIDRRALRELFIRLGTQRTSASTETDDRVLSE